MKLPNPDDVSAAIRQAAAQEVMPRFRQLTAHDIREKGPGDLVTAADEACERQLTPLLQHLLPGSIVVGEESAAADPSVIEAFGGSAPVWVIDPVDGTANFAAGDRTFAVMVALVLDDEPVAGWIFDPIGKRLAVAEKGGGARDENGEALTVSSAGTLTDMQGWLSLKFVPEPRRSLVRSRLDRVGETRSLFCAGHEYLALAGGHRHFSSYQRTWPWDHAPGVLIHREAGGYSARLDGRPYRASVRNGGLLCAPDKDAWGALSDALFAET